MDGDQAAMIFADPPYNVRVADIVGRGRVKHSEFAMASGVQLRNSATFSERACRNLAAVSRPGSVHFICVDWRHIDDLLAAGRDTYSDVLNVVVWVKTNAGQGSFYRSQHELIAVFRAGDAPHCNNVQLGRYGRNRTNVWSYPGVNTFGRNRLDDLARHPTVKPVAMIADAIKDCTRRGDVVLDTFGGSGSTMWPVNG